MPGSPQEINLSQWSSPPANAAMVAFGSINVQNSRVIMNGWLFDAKNTQSPQVLGQQYNEAAGPDTARHIAHEFADAIIARLGGGINGIAESKIYYISDRSGNKEVWEMDYDGANQHQVTHVSAICLSPRISPDGSRLAFDELNNRGGNIRIFSMRPQSSGQFSVHDGTDYSLTAWAPDGNSLAFSSSRSGDPEIWISSASGFGLRRVTAYRGPDVSARVQPRRPAIRLRGSAAAPACRRSYIMESRRHQRAAFDRRRICHVARLVPERTITRLCMVAALWARRSRRAGHLRDGHRQPSLDAAHARYRPHGLSVLVARWSPHCFSAYRARSQRNLDHVGGWYQLKHH